ncbi:MAG TPA: ferritin-like domain-containing protein [Pyrinomonadaceae bacterium]|nr:ferritin-like domain-containing protein [Pyrinomonadaceae bacterium]
METIFDKVDSALVENLSEHPEALLDSRYLTSSAAASRQTVNSELFNPANGRTPLNQPLPPQIVAALNLALAAEFLETAFYSTGLNTPNLIPNELRQVFVRILLNEVGHRETLLTVLGRNAIPKPTFDFTGRGAVPDVFTNFNSFTALSQTFEDNGVRAIKGQAGNVMSDDFVLTTALRFHSVEARHASEVRRIRGQKGWITLNQRGNLPAISQGVYDGEENTVQGGIDLVALTGLPAATVSEAFDEPLTADQVLRNLAPFVRFRRGRGGINPFKSEDADNADGNKNK